MRGWVHGTQGGVGQLRVSRVRAVLYSAGSYLILSYLRILYREYLQRSDYLLAYLLKMPGNFVHQNLEIEMIESRREYAHRDQRGRYVGASQEKN